MLRKCKKTLPVIGMILLLSGLFGCGAPEAQNPAPADPAPVETEEAVNEDDPDEGMGDLIEDEEIADDADVADNPQETEEAGDSYEALYKKQTEELQSQKMADRFALVKIDEDDIPELVAADSAGSFDHENAFIYTIHDGKCALLCSAITGVDGASIAFCEGKNIILQSGGIAGATDAFSKIEDGKLTEVFRAEMIDTLKTDAEDEEIYKYSVNGKDADKKAYIDELTKFTASCEPLTRIDYDGLNTVTLKNEQDSVWFEQTENHPFEKVYF